MSWNQQQQLLPIFKLKETDMKGINFPTHYERIPLLLDPLSQSETVVLITIFHFTLIESSQAKVKISEIDNFHDIRKLIFL